MRNIGSSFLFLVACGTEATSRPPGIGGDPAPDAPGSSSPSKTGTISILNMDIFGTAVRGASAAFHDGVATNGSERVDGACVISTGTGTSPPRVSAGDVTITHNGAVLALMHEADHDYTVFEQGKQFGNGDTLVLAATGDTVPAFSKMIRFPSAITVTTPAPPQPGSPFILNKSGFTASWTSSTPVRITISQTGVRINCRYDGVSSATVPASALADIVPGPGIGDENEISILISSELDTVLDANPFEARLLVTDVEFNATGIAQ